MLTFLSIDAVFLLVALGLSAGVMAGLLGVGGGLIIVPVLIFVFESWQFPEQHLTQMAVASSLATIVFTSLSSVYAHHKNAMVDWSLVLRLAFGISFGAIAGAYIASAMAGSYLRLLFGIFAMAVALQMFLNIGVKADSQGRQSIDKLFLQLLAGFLTAFVSAMFGIGGGSISVPLLTWLGLDMKKAVAASAACGFPIALFSVIGFVALSYGNPELPEGSIGLVYLPAVLIISFCSVLAAPFGARLAFKLPAGKLKKIFAVFLSIVGLRLIVGSL